MVLVVFPACLLVYRAVLFVNPPLRRKLRGVDKNTAARFCVFLSRGVVPWGVVVFGLFLRSCRSFVWVPAVVRARCLPLRVVAALWVVSLVFRCRFSFWRALPLGPLPVGFRPAGWSVSLRLGRGAWCSRPVAFVLVRRSVCWVLRAL